MTYFKKAHTIKIIILVIGIIISFHHISRGSQMLRSEVGDGDLYGRIKNVLDTEDKYENLKLRLTMPGTLGAIGMLGVPVDIVLNKETGEFEILKDKKTRY